MVGTVLFGTRYSQFDSRSGSGWGYTFTSPREIFATDNIAEVRSVLTQAVSAANSGAWVGVALSYESAPAFDPAFVVRGSSPLPLIWCAVYDAPTREHSTPSPLHHSTHLRLTPSLSEAEYTEQYRAIIGAIQRGDIYQMNYTFPLSGEVEVDDPISLYHHIALLQGAPYSAYFDLGPYKLLSFSPELFFERRGSHLITRPMKGTAPRGRWSEEDTLHRENLRHSEKDQAENVMIVDLLRNDLSRIALPGTVRASSLFDLEPYHRVWQMTSTVEAEIPKELSTQEILQALFPCGSITGAPKIRAMELIAAHEHAPRGFYTGALGLIRPGGDAVFNVAIRTALLGACAMKHRRRRHDEAISNIGALTTVNGDLSAVDFPLRGAKGKAKEEVGPEFPLLFDPCHKLSEESRKHLSFHVGSGITFSSHSRSEYQECLAKGAFLNDLSTSSTDFDLVETLRLENGELFFLERHLRRLEESARYFSRAFGNKFDRGLVESTLNEAARRHPELSFRVRLLYSPNHHCSVTLTPLDAPFSHSQPLRLGIAAERIDERDPFLFHKTTKRLQYDRAKALQPEFDDLVFLNSRGEVTESLIANIVVRSKERLVTPPRECGILCGTFREELLEKGEIVEERILLEQLLEGSFWLVNSVRGWIPASICRSASAK